MLLKKTREGIARFLMGRKLRQLERNREMKHLEECRTVLLLASLHEDPEVADTKAFADYLRGHGAEVSFLVFNPDTKKNKLIYLNDIEFLTNDHLNRLFTPNTPEVERMLNREFDLLADLSLQSRFPLEYCCCMSRARLKAGAAMNYKMRACDVTIDISGKPTIGFLTGQMKHYLTAINKKEHVA